MTNVQMEVKGKKLVIEVDLSKSFGRSKTGKTIQVATTHGFANVGADGNQAMVSLNVNRYPKQDE